VIRGYSYASFSVRAVFDLSFSISACMLVSQPVAACARESLFFAFMPSREIYSSFTLITSSSPC